MNQPFVVRLFLSVLVVLFFAGFRERHPRTVVTQNHKGVTFQENRPNKEQCQAS
jgi:hypothetical protein